MNKTCKLAFDPNEFVQTVRKKQALKPKQSLFSDEYAQSDSGEMVEVEEFKLPFRDLRIFSLWSLVLIGRAAQDFRNLRILKVYNVAFPSPDIAEIYMPVFIQLSK